MRRRRKAKYTWFPTNGELIDRTGQAQFYVNGKVLQMAAAAGVDVAHLVTPLVFHDFPLEDATGTDTLVDVVGQEYITKRIVGNAFGVPYLTGTLNAASPGAAIIGLGLFVARADGNDPTLPAGWAGTTVEQHSRNFNPLEFQTIREPWMFRRTWVCATSAPQTRTNYQGTEVEASAQRVAHGRWPSTTAHYTGMNQSSFFDIKSARRIRQDERLWAVAACAPFPYMYGGGAPAAGWELRCDLFLDYRILGALRKAKNRSNF